MKLMLTQRNINLENNASLVQINDKAVNTGKIKSRAVTGIKAKDYVYWSTPVGQNWLILQLLNICGTQR
jgi:hypothetical protein